MKAGKVWGSTEPLLEVPTVSIHWLEVEPDARCSRHHHDRRWNAFLVIRGEITVEVEQSAYALTDRTVLGPGDLTTVAPGLVHRFESGPHGATLVELYYPPWVDPTDIVRADVGSIGLAAAEPKASSR